MQISIISIIEATQIQSKLTENFLFHVLAHFPALITARFAAPPDFSISISLEESARGETKSTSESFARFAMNQTRSGVFRRHAIMGFPELFCWLGEGGDGDDEVEGKFEVQS
jgi:hypothetical protein